MGSESAGDAEGSLSGTLELDGELLPVDVGYASRISLYVSFHGETPPDQTTFQKLRLSLEGQKVELSICRLHVEYTRIGYSGRLIFLEDVYDCRALLFERKVVNLKGFFQKLPLVIAQKGAVKPEFKDYVSDTLYDLAVWKRFFNEQDRIFANEPIYVADAAQQALLRTEGQEFFRFFDGTLEKLAALVGGYSKEEHERHGYYLRRHAWEFILGSEFLKRTNLKPRGYAGDADMMVMIYENQYVGNYIFNRLMHKHPVETPAAQAVRNRRRWIPQVMRTTRAHFPNLGTGGFRILSLACGPAWELQDLLLTPEDFEAYHISLLDQDTHALESARTGVRKIEAARDARVRVRYINDSVRTMLRKPDLAERLGGKYHFIYTMGLFDYLTPPVAKAVVRRIYGLLVPGGTMIVGNYHSRNPSAIYMAYWGDWVLYARTEEDMMDLAVGLEGASSQLAFEATRAQMFLQVDKVG
ncbi:MAG TPA: class I SAM-dependent methyltransferase [Myxococcaceae bacterium]|nr:class I SAM-dependent methyltransferase [Myxococcaceae bacterium]